MRRALRSVFLAAAVLVTAVFLGTAACASNYDAHADALKEMGLFLGGDAGYELDRASTRGEAAVMLVRLLGREEEAKAGTYADPFTDVPSWAEQYVGYMYGSGLTKGTSPTTFSAVTGCSAQMFTAFVLRALGYTEENGDFTFAGAEEFALQIGLTAGCGSSGTFLRDDMVALAYSALFQPMNDGSGKMLLEKLDAEGAVDAAAADKYLASYRTYKNYVALSTAAGQESAGNVKTHSVMDMSMAMEDASFRMTQTTDTAIVLEGDSFVMKQQSVSGILGLTTETTTYYADGWVYTESGEEKYKYQTQIEPGDAKSEALACDSSGLLFYLIGSIEKTGNAGGTTYTVVYSAAAMNGMLGVLSEVVDTTESGSMRFQSLTGVIKFDAGGNIQSTSLSAVVDMETPAGEETPAVSMRMTLEMTTTVVARGSAVTVTLPSDLSEYQDLASEAVSGVETA